MSEQHSAPIDYSSLFNFSEATSASDFQLCASESLVPQNTEDNVLVSGLPPISSSVWDTCFRSDTPRTDISDRPTSESLVLT